MSHTVNDSPHPPAAVLRPFIKKKERRKITTQISDASDSIDTFHPLKLRCTLNCFAQNNHYSVEDEKKKTDMNGFSTMIKVLLMFGWSSLLAQ